MVHIFRTPTPKAGRSVTFASSPVKSDGRLLGPTNLKSTVGQYSRTDHTNTVMVARLVPPVQGSTVEEKYSTNDVSDHWSNLPTAVKNLRLTAIKFPSPFGFASTGFKLTLEGNRTFQVHHAELTSALPCPSRL